MHHRFQLSRAAGPLLLIAAALFAAAPPCYGSTPTEQYLAARRTSPPRPGLTLQAAAQNPDACRGMTLEIAGRLLGWARTDEGASLMLATDNNGTLNLTMSRMPDWIQPGERLRALVVIGGAGGDGAAAVIGAPDLLIVAVASASDIAAAEARWQASEQERVRRGQQTRAAIARAGAVLGQRRGRGSSPRASLDARSAHLSRSLSPNARAVYEPYRAAIRGYNRRLTEREVDAITSAILIHSEQMGVDPRLVIALVIAESSFDPGATSRVGAMGLGQIMPGTAREIGLANPYDPVQNIAGAVYLLKTRLDKYSAGGDVTMGRILALASYNAGMGAVKRHKGVPPYRETRNYVKKVEKIYRRLCGEGGSS